MCSFWSIYNKNHAMKKVIQLLICFFLVQLMYSQDADTIMNSDLYPDAGQGIRIGIIDHNWPGIPAMQDTNAAPPSTHLECFPHPCHLLDVADDRWHGTACLEMVYKHAPEADYYIYDISAHPDTFAADFRKAIKIFIEQEVNIISISVLDLRDSWYDGAGLVGQAIKSATDQGIMVFVAAGNSAENHWQGPFRDVDSNNIHEWNIKTSDESNYFEIDPGSNVTSYLIWDEPHGGTTNWYDLQLVEVPHNILKSGKTKDIGEFEKLKYTNTSGDTMKVYFQITKNNVPGPPPDLELYEFQRGRGVSLLEYWTSASSIGGTSGSQEPNCLAVAAVRHGRYNEPIDSSVITGYSSRGPTNEGNLGPDLTSVTSVYIVSNPDDTIFGGTSCATPNAAGATAAFWSSQSNYSADGVRQVILRKAQLYKDWGDQGPDNTYGYGGMYLYDYYPKTEYVHFNGDNDAASCNKPWLNLQQVDTSGVYNSRVVILGGSYDTSSPILLTNPKVYVSLKRPAVIK